MGEREKTTSKKGIVIDLEMDSENGGGEVVQSNEMDVEVEGVTPVSVSRSRKNSVETLDHLQRKNLSFLDDLDVYEEKLEQWEKWKEFCTAGYEIVNDFSFRPKMITKNDAEKATEALVIEQQHDHDIHQPNILRAALETISNKNAKKKATSKVNANEAETNQKTTASFPNLSKKKWNPTESVNDDEFPLQDGWSVVIEHGNTTTLPCKKKPDEETGLQNALPGVLIELPSYLNERREEIVPSISVLPSVEILRDENERSQSGSNLEVTFDVESQLAGEEGIHFQCAHCFFGTNDWQQFQSHLDFHEVGFRNWI